MKKRYIQRQDFSGKKILVVDDNEILLKAWKRILERENCIYHCTADPEDAIKWIEAEKPDILITDIVMPKMDGFALLKAAKERQKDLMVVLTTGYVCDFTNVNFNAPVKDIHLLLKPYNSINQIQEFIERLLSGDRSMNRQKYVESRDHCKVHLWQL